MRFLHTSDLHLGKFLSDVSLAEDQRYILDQIVHIAEEERAEAVLIAGDVYQRATPQAEAVAMFDSFVSSLASSGIRVFTISGNHDSAQRVSYFSSLVRDAGVYMNERFDGRLQCVELQDEEGCVAIWMLPFIRASEARRKIPMEKITNQQEAMEAILKQTQIDRNKRNVLIAHQFILGSSIASSEEQYVGSIDAVSGALYDAFDYVALGHIHRPQAIGRETLRYSGSPLKYDFSEAGIEKSVTIVDLQSKESVLVRTVSLRPKHDVRKVEGLIKDLMRMDYTEDYVWVTVHDELVPPDARVSLSVVFPNMLKYSIVNSKTKLDMDVLAAEKMEQKTVTELFCDFYRLQNNDQMPGKEHMKELERILRRMEGRPHETA